MCERVPRQGAQRMETPWVDRAPLEIVRSNIRFSLQPIDAPPEPDVLNRLFDHMQSDELLLFSTNYPHWQFEATRRCLMDYRPISSTRS